MWTKSEKLDWRTIDMKGDLATAFRLAYEACNPPNSIGMFTLAYQENKEVSDYNLSIDEYWHAEMRQTDYGNRVEADAGTPESALLQVTVKFLAKKEMRPIEVQETIKAVDGLDDVTIRELLKRELAQRYLQTLSEFRLLDEIRKRANLPESIT